MTEDEASQAAEEARRQAIHELRLAIVALEVGEFHNAENHAQASVAWMHEIA